MLAGPRDDVAPVQPGEQEPEEQERPAVMSTTEPPPVAGDAAPVEPTGPVGDTTDPAAAPPPDAPLDGVCAGAVELARAAAVEVGGPAVGAHLGVEADGDLVATHSFATSEAGYVGWRWAVTVARARDGDAVTVDEVVLLPGSGALLAPAWVPWSERVQPGDLTPGDLLPPVQDDPRLVPSYADVDAEQMPFALHRELGLDRPRVLSRDGRLEAAERWYDGDAGPDSPMAKAAPGQCGGCGFLVPLAGSLGRVFGACANAMAPDDGRVVALTHGCGAHSETVVEVPMSSYAGMAVEDDEFLVVDRSVPEIAGDEVVPGSDAVGVELAGDEADGGDEVDGVDEADGVVEADGEQVVEQDGLVVPAEAAAETAGEDAQVARES